MKRTIFWLGMLLMILAFGVAVVACDIQKDELDGTTWRASSNVENYGTINHVLTFDSPNFTWRQTLEGQTHTLSGTYTISGKNVTMTIEGHPLPATLSGNTLIYGEGLLTFTKQ